MQAQSNDTPVKIALTRAERDVVWDHLEIYVGSDSHYLSDLIALMGMSP
jgi:hypothetical protein